MVRQTIINNLKQKFLIKYYLYFQPGKYSLHVSNLAKLLRSFCETLPHKVSRISH